MMQKRRPLYRLQWFQSKWHLHHLHHCDAKRTLSFLFTSNRSVAPSPAKSTVLAKEEENTAFLHRCFFFFVCSLRANRGSSSSSSDEQHTERTTTLHSTAIAPRERSPPSPGKPQHNPTTRKRRFLLIRLLDPPRLFSPGQLGQCHPLHILSSCHSARGET